MVSMVFNYTKTDKKMKNDSLPYCFLISNEHKCELFKEILVVGCFILKL